MDEYTAETFANQEEQCLDETEGADASSSASRSRLSSHYIRDKWHSVTRTDDTGKASEGSPGLSLQDRLLASLLQQVIPSDETDNDDGEMDGKPAQGQTERPAFSLPLMTNNFRRFNARVGILFKFQNYLIDIFTWRHRTRTWSFLFVYSFLCVDPYLLAVLPLVAVLFMIMIPAFLARHPPPPPSASTSSITPYYSYEGPALAPATTIKPASETSKDFFHNMRDLQNCMADFALLHDTAVAYVAPSTNFSNETLSSSLFLIFTLLAATLFLTAHLLPWRFINLVVGNGMLLSNHPNAGYLLDVFQKAVHSPNTQAGANSIGESQDNTAYIFFGYSIPTTSEGLLALYKSLTPISLSATPEEREVEIFELQHKTHSPYCAAPEWEPFLFTPTPYDPLSPAKIAGDRPRGTRFFEDVRPPLGWAWKSKKWELDLECREWVMERMVTGVEFEIPGSNGGSLGEEVGGWVWDLPFNPPDQESYGNEESTLPYSTSWEVPQTVSQSPNTTGSSKNAVKENKLEWEEATKHGDRAGEWRRRRWVRVVQRMIDGKSSSSS